MKRQHIDAVSTDRLEIHNRDAPDASETEDTSPGTPPARKILRRLLETEVRKAMYELNEEIPTVTTRKEHRAASLIPEFDPDRTTFKDTNDLVLTVNGQKLTNWVEKFDDNSYKILQKNYTIFENETMNITCEARNELKNLSFYYRKPNGKYEDVELETKHQCADYQHCKKISLDLTPHLGSSLICKSKRNDQKVTKLVLSFHKGLPNVSIKINESVKAVGPNQTDVTYLYNNNDVIQAECVHNTFETLQIAIWNFYNFISDDYGYVKDNRLTKGGHFAVIKLTKDISGWYIDCQDTSSCNQLSTCKPPFIRLRFVLRPNNKIVVSYKMLTIKGLKTENIIFDNGTIISYKFQHGDKIELTCLKTPKHTHKSSHSKFHLTWYKSGQNLTRTNRFEDEVKQNFLLHDVDNGSLITCTLDEDVDQNGLANGLDDFAPYHENKSIILFYEKYMANTERPTTVQAMASAPEPTDRVPTQLGGYSLIFASCAIVTIIIIIILICIIIKQSRKNKVSEDKRHLRTANSSVKSQSSESITKIDATYSSPRDATDRNGFQDPTIHCNVYQSDTYSIPFTETREVYSVPIPKKFRSLKTPIKEDNISNNKYYTYARNYQNGYSNVGYNSPNRKQYENLDNDRLSDAPSSLYSEINNKY
ncbi:unnamed protein product, partial [Brenthis ino]